MDNMIVNAMDKILELRKPNTIKDEYDREYMIRGYEKVKETTFPTLQTNSLQSIIDYVKENKENYFVINIESHKKVKLISRPFGKHQQRDEFIIATAMTPNYITGRYQEQEDFIVNLLTCFEESEGREYALSIASHMVEGKEVKVADDGITQRATLSQGVSTLKDEEVNPFINLVPYRTFLEVEQPKSLFLIRLRKGPTVAIFESDGGAWKYQAIQNIVDYFENELEDHREQIQIIY